MRFEHASVNFIRSWPPRRRPGWRVVILGLQSCRCLFHEPLFGENLIIMPVQHFANSIEEYRLCVRSGNRMSFREANAARNETVWIHNLRVLCHMRGIVLAQLANFANLPICLCRLDRSFRPNHAVSKPHFSNYLLGLPALNGTEHLLEEAERSATETTLTDFFIVFGNQSSQ